ncbi:MAG: hypothetical protein F6J92_33230 [Symploca sp. SIO1A3]|nr:hypothetical protein [Symploca sp. SIO1A3]
MGYQSINTLQVRTYPIVKYPTTKSCAIAIVVGWKRLEFHHDAIAFTVGAHRRAPFSIAYPFNLR